MSRYNSNYERNENAVFFQVFFAILGAALVIGTIAGIVTYLKNEAEERQLKILMSEAKKDIDNIFMPLNNKTKKDFYTNKKQNSRAYPIYQEPQISLPKSREQIIRENSRKTYQDTIKGISEFKKYYQKPERCNEMKDHETRVFCANHFMRAKKEWDKEHLTLH
jgi:hypothetical protein